MIVVSILVAAIITVILWASFVLANIPLAPWVLLVIFGVSLVLSYLALSGRGKDDDPIENLVKGL